MRLRLALVAIVVCGSLAVESSKRQDHRRGTKVGANAIIKRRRGIIIRCCGTKRCIGDTNILYTNATNKPEVASTQSSLLADPRASKEVTALVPKDTPTEPRPSAPGPEAAQTAAPEEAPPQTSAADEATTLESETPLDSSVRSIEATTTASTEESTSSSSTSSTTTTQCPSTTPVHCKGFVDAQSMGDAIVLKPDNEKLWTRNGSTYVVFTLLSTLAQAAGYCLRKGMTLPALQDQTELATLTQISEEISGAELWTSGFVTKVGGPCDPVVSLFWCPSAALSANAWWSSVITRLDNSSVGNYVTAANGSLKLANETSELKFACKCARPNMCPSCATNASLINPDGTLKENRKGSSWRSFCGKTFYFTSDMGTWEQNMARCCALGMRTVWFRDAGEMSCVAREIATSNWSLGLNFWTGGAQQGCWGQWGWCGPAGPDHAPFDSLAWASGQPDNANASEGCLHMRVLRNSTGLVLSDRNCASKYFIACQGAPTFTGPCGAPSCIQECENNSTLFTMTILNTPAQYGNWIQGCGRDYLFAKSKMTWDAAHKFCCSVNARLLSVERLDLLDCLTTIANKVPVAKYSWALGREFWTSGTNRNCTGSYGWCSAKSQSLDNREARWRAGHPKQVEGQCITVTLQDREADENSSEATATCSDLKQPICERPKRPTDSMQKSFECSETWKLTDDEMKTIYRPRFNASTAPRHIKCYIKCVGLGYNLFDFGSSQYSPALALMMETASGENDAIFQAGVAGLEDCSKRYDDECTTAAAYYGCNNEKNPVLMSSMIGSTNSSSPASADPNAGTASGDCVATHWRTCPPAPNCTVDVPRRNALLISGSDAKGVMVTTRAGRKYYLLGKLSQTHTAHSAYCCELGMRGAIFDTEEAFVDWRDSPRPNEGGFYVMFGASHDNGDDSDSWCATFQPVPPSITANVGGIYGDCGRTTPSLIIFDWNMKPQVASFTGTAHYFLCQ